MPLFTMTTIICIISYRLCSSPTVELSVAISWLDDLWPGFQYVKLSCFIVKKAFIDKPFISKFSLLSPYNPYDISLENLVFDKLIIPWLIYFFILVTCLCDNVLRLWGEILSWSLLGVKGIKPCSMLLLGFSVIFSCIHLTCNRNIYFNKHLWIILVATSSLLVWLLGFSPCKLLLF